MTGSKGRTEFISALCTPFAVARGWVVHCNREKELLLIRLVAVEVYPPHDSDNIRQSDAQGLQSMRNDVFRGSSNSKRFSPGVDFGTQGVYAALPLESIARNDVRNPTLRTLIFGSQSECEVIEFDHKSHFMRILRSANLLFLRRLLVAKQAGAPGASCVVVPPSVFVLC